MSIKSYILMARPSHWFKNLFMIPGAVFAFLEFGPPVTGALITLTWGFISTCFIASANYLINEILDAKYDKYHPIKRQRAAVSGKISIGVVYVLYTASLCMGSLIGFLFVNVPFGITVLALAICGIFYNVPPIRLKEFVYVDVIFESFNNVIRLFLGWFCVTPFLIPPVSVVLAFWFAGAFLMTAKRYAEYRFIGDPEKAGQYRRSFKYYDEKKLLLCCLFYASSFSFFFGIFLYKYRIEYILLFPLFSGLFAWYMRIAMKKFSPAQNPQSLYREKRLGLMI